MVLFLNGRLGESLMILHHVEKAIERSQQTYNSLVNSQINQKSNNLNHAMRVFASIATMFLPLQVISGIFGMNVPVPWQFTNEGDDLKQGAFWGIVGFMIIIALSFYISFRKRNWL